ncbi:hypothetical protein EON82_00670 [bacterium]|nr:MAG: hypothetical protein EON82_00670 [bacterium]
MMRLEYERILGWGIPIVCILTSALTLNAKRNEFIEASAQRDEAAVRLASTRQEQLAVASQPQERRFAAVDGDKLEETRFLDDLRSRAAAAGVTVIGWTSQTTTYGMEGETKLTDKSLAGLSKVSCNLTVGGSYVALRRFIRDLSEADRLFTVSHIDWRRSSNATELAMTLGRYVTNPLVASGAAKP